MQFLICLEASHQRGMGHLYRGLNLADALRDHGNRVVIVVNDDARAVEIIRQRGFVTEVVRSYSDGLMWEEPLVKSYTPDWWINDRLDTTPAHGAIIKDSGVRLATFDDHGEGAGLATFNFLAMEPAPVTRRGNALYGPEYIILNPEIGRLRRKERQGPPRNLLITLGGSDTYGVTPRVVAALSRLPDEMGVQVAAGPNFRHHRELEAARESAARPVVVMYRVPDLVTVMAEADIVICSGGVTLFEAAALGLPAITIANEPHEITTAAWFEANGTSVYAGFHRDDFCGRLTAGLEGLLSDRERLSRIGEKGKLLVDARGLDRVIGLLGGTP
jgi:spore coat polysaccharide biosynthesis predicted glycosyltransferase SpsG